MPEPSPEPQKSTQQLATQFITDEEDESYALELAARYR
jgi:hypothetical protein